MIFRFDEFELDPVNLELRRGGSGVKADALVLRLLGVLVERAGELVGKQELVARVWGDRAVSENVITVAMTRLRKTLGQTAAREFVVNVHGRGYRFVRPVSTRPESLRAAPAVERPTLRGLPFVGRDAVLARLRGALEGARAGSGGLCALMGEAGIGKTSAVEVLEAEARTAGFAVGWGYCREGSDTPPLWPFVTVLRDLVGVRGDAELDERLSNTLEELRPTLPELRRGGSSPPPGAAADGARPPGPVNHRLFDGIVRALSLLSELSPCFVVLDDLQSADSASLELLRYFIPEIARSRVLVAATVRDGTRPRAPGDSHLSHVLGHRNTTRIDLERLDQVAVTEYVCGVARDPDATFARAVFLKSEGNPFFMAEFVRHSRDGKEPGGDGLAVSDAAYELLRQRISSLDRSLRGLLSIASVIGNPFDLALLRTVAGEDAAATMEALDAAVAGDVVVHVFDSTTIFRFAHELLRGVLYEALDDASRRKLHLGVLRALEARAAAGGAVLSADLAFHAHAALPEGDPREAVRYSREAAVAASLRRAYGDGVRHLRHAREALELVPRASPRLRMNLLLQQALFARVCSSPDFEPAVRAAIDLAREQRSPPSLARAALMLDLHPGFPALAGARSALEEALEGLSAEDEARGAVLGRLANAAPIAFDEEAASTRLSEALALADESKSLLSLYTARGAFLYSRGGPAHDGEATRVLSELDELCERHPNTLAVTPVVLEMHRAIRAAQRGSMSAALSPLERAARRCRQLGNHELLWHVDRFLLLSRANTSGAASVATELRAHHLRARREALVGTAMFAQYDEGVVLSSASPPACEALAFDRGDPPSVWASKIRGLCAAGRHEEALLGLLRVTPEALARLPCDRDHLGTLGALSRAAVELGALGHAEALDALLAPFEEQFAIHVTFHCEGSVLQLRGELAAALGRAREAEERLEEGALLAERAGFLPCAGRGRRALATLRGAASA